MPFFRVTGKDIFHEQPRELYFDAPSAEQALSYAADKGVRAESIAELSRSDIPPTASIIRIQPPQAPISDAELFAQIRRRRFRLAMLGVALGLFVIAGTFFVLRAKEHIMKGRGNDAQTPSWQR
ncbi:MAG: hypothetical protein IBJ18_13705 [Phycisphaerales bacterium]|nr:hypothetical protein [Phycisphaerales bacterium]